MTFEVNVQIVITFIAASVAVGATISFLLKKMVDNFVQRSLATQKSELDKQLEKLKAVNMRMNHIIVSLYDEEVKALKDFVISLHEVTGMIFNNANASIDNMLGLTPLPLFSLDKFVASYNKLCSTVEICSIFSNEDLYKMMTAFRGYVQPFIKVFHSSMQNPLQQKEQIDELIEKRNTLINAVRVEIIRKKREYIEI